MEAYRNKAYEECMRTKGMTAFNFRYNPIKRKLNQHVTRYTFDDGSMLTVHTTTNGMRVYTAGGVCYVDRMLWV